MTAPDLDEVARRYSAALNAKPSKGEWTQRGIDALTDSVSDVGALLAEVERWRMYRDAEFERLGVALAERDAARREESLSDAANTELNVRLMKAEAQVQAVRELADDWERCGEGYAAAGVRDAAEGERVRVRAIRAALDTGSAS